MIWDEVTYTPEGEISDGGRQAITERTEAEAVMRQGLPRRERHILPLRKKIARLIHAGSYARLWRESDLAVAKASRRVRYQGV